MRRSWEAFRLSGNKWQLSSPQRKKWRLLNYISTHLWLKILFQLFHRPQFYFLWWRIIVPKPQSHFLFHSASFFSTENLNISSHSLSLLSFYQTHSTTLSIIQSMTPSPGASIEHHLFKHADRGALWQHLSLILHKTPALFIVIVNRLRHTGKVTDLSFRKDLDVLPFSSRCIWGIHRLLCTQSVATAAPAVYFSYTFSEACS